MSQQGFDRRMDLLLKGLADILQDVPKESPVKKLFMEVKVVGWIGNELEQPIIRQVWGSFRLRGLPSWPMFAYGACFGIALAMTVYALSRVW